MNDACETCLNQGRPKLCPPAQRMKMEMSEVPLKCRFARWAGPYNSFFGQPQFFAKYPKVRKKILWSIWVKAHRRARYSKEAPVGPNRSANAFRYALRVQLEILAKEYGIWKP